MPPADKEKARVGRRPSLRRRLGLLGLLTLAVSLGLVGLALDAAFRNSAEADLRRQMETWAYLVLAATEIGPDGALAVNPDLGDPMLGQPGSGVYARVETPRESFLSSSALGQTMPALALAEPGIDRFLPPVAGGQEGAVEGFVLQLGLAWELEESLLLPFTVSVVVDQSMLQARLAAFRAGLWRSLGAAGALLALAQLLFLFLSLRPLRQVASDVARIERGEQELLGDGPGGGYLRELEPLTRNLQRLLSTEKSNQARYRNALDSLAHSLKTPLAVIRSHPAASNDPALQSAVADMQHLISTRLQRAAANTRRTLVAPVAVQPLAERLAAALRRVHSQHLRSLELKIEPGLLFYGEERDLLEVVGNLLENACKYGDGQVRLSAGAIGAGQSRPGLWLEVDNDGPSVALEPYLGRGVRGDERAEGQGLGLAIVSEVVSAYGGSIAFGASSLGGTQVRITFPGE
jgi:two-component system sensor histidine kinase PhoQ